MPSNSEQMGTNLFLAGRGAENDDPNRALLTTNGTVLAVVGLVLIIWPGVGAITISWLVAALAFLIGALLVFLALRLRRVNCVWTAWGSCPGKACSNG